VWYVHRVRYFRHRLEPLSGPFSLEYFRFKLLAQQKGWPSFMEMQYDWLVNRGIDLAKFGLFKFYYETLGGK
jgi:hypothetical protein